MEQYGIIIIIIIIIIINTSQWLCARSITRPTRISGPYATVRSWNGQQGDQVTLLSPTATFKNGVQLSFYYHMLIRDEDTTAALTVFTYSQMHVYERRLIEIRGNHGISWQWATVCLPEGTYQLAFVATHGLQFLSDIALDNIELDDDDRDKCLPHSVREQANRHDGEYFTYRNHVVVHSGVSTRPLKNGVYFGANINVSGWGRRLQVRVRRSFGVANLHFLWSNYPHSKCRCSVYHWSETTRTHHASELHWLPVRQRVRFKLACIMYKSLHGQAPSTWPMMSSFSLTADGVSFDQPTTEHALSHEHRTVSATETFLFCYSNQNLELSATRTATRRHAEIVSV